MSGPAAPVPYGRDKMLEIRGCLAKRGNWLGAKAVHSFGSQADGYQAVERGRMSMR